MNLSPLPIQKFFDNNGSPLARGQLFVYTAGTTTKATTYTDSTGGTPNTNPLVLNARGEAQVWLDPTKAYKFVIAPATDTDPPTAAIWTVDQIESGLTYTLLVSLLTQSFLGAILNPRNAAEIAASVTPTNYQNPTDLPELPIVRYGNNTVPGTTDTTSLFTQATSVAYRGLTDGTNHPIVTFAGAWAVSSSISVNYAVSIKGAGGSRSTSIVPLSNLGSNGVFRLGDAVHASFGTKLTDLLIQSGGVNSAGVVSSDLQDGGCERVTVNNFVDYGFRMDGSLGSFGSINGYLMSECQAFKANSGGTGGIAYSLKSGTFFPLYQLCQSTGNKNNPLAAAFNIDATPVVLVATNADGSVGGAGIGVVTGISIATTSPMAVVMGHTALQNTNAVSISTTGAALIGGLYTSGCTNSVVDSGNGGGIAKTLTQAVVPLLWRGSSEAHGDFLRIWGGFSLAQSSTAPATANNGTITTASTPLSRVAPTGNVTGIILQAGTKEGQEVTVLNESAFTLTMAAAATSNVADGVTTVVPALRAMKFVWGITTSRWYTM